MSLLWASIEAGDGVYSNIEEVLDVDCLVHPTLSSEYKFLCLLPIPARIGSSLYCSTWACCRQPPDGYLCLPEAGRRGVFPAGGFLGGLSFFADAVFLLVAVPRFFWPAAVPFAPCSGMVWRHSG